MVKCPECGHKQETKNESCSNCHRVFRYDDLANYEPSELAFTVAFECKNCSRTFKHGFTKGDEVYPKGSRRNPDVVNRVTGNQYRAEIDGYPCILQCLTCESDSSLVISERNPIRER